MATILLSAAGAAVGGSVGGTVLGLSAAVAGRFAGAALGRVIDQRIIGAGSDAVETGRVERFRLTSAGEGDTVPRVYGRMRIAGQVIWASQFSERTTVSQGSKGAPRTPIVASFSYRVSLAVALCEGEIAGVGRIWADGTEISPEALNIHVYTGSATQLPDPKIEAIEGAGTVPAYRGTAYVVIEDLDLAQFGSRVPQFTFEVLRPAPAALQNAATEPSFAIRGVAMMPGSGEYALATTPVSYDYGAGRGALANVNSPSGKSDLATSLDQLNTSLPNCEAVSLIVSWFGNDLRCGDCTIRPKVEQNQHDGSEMPWQVAGLDRSNAQVVAQDGAGRPIYGGTPTDASVIEAIQAMNAAGKAVMFYPFMLMDQGEDNTLPNPYDGNSGQPALPWRGRITGSRAPQLPGAPDGSAAQLAEVSAFFGTAAASDFVIAPGNVAYSGPQEWRYRRFILHCAALCAAAGGVDSFCIGSEMRGLTQLRGAANSFPAVAALCSLAAEVRSILGPGTKIGYAADWSEYSGYQPEDDSGDRFFHLDPLWADSNIDFIGIDNYLPLSDWHDGDDHLDAANHRSIYDPDYLMGNIEGGELFDWYYATDADRAAQIRAPISDGAYGEPWVYRIKDVASWWRNTHHDRIGGVRQLSATNWVPQSKPIWFTELGCAAIDKGTNQPNKFLDPKSSESARPFHSDGQRDDTIQMQYLRAMYGYWGDPAHNPISAQYGGPMIDMSRGFVWAWDARPFPYFPTNRTLWSDGANYHAGHWITGRASNRSLALVVAEICEAAGLTHYDVSGLYGSVSGYLADTVSEARRDLQPLMLRYGFDAVERNGQIVFVMRTGRASATVNAAEVALTREVDGRIEHQRASEAELAGRMRLKFIEAEADFAAITEEAILPDDSSRSVAGSEMPLSMWRGEGRQVVERWLAESRVARDTLRLALPPSRRDIGAGDTIELVEDGTSALFRIDRTEAGESTLIEAVRVKPQVYLPAGIDADPPRQIAFQAPLPVLPLFLDLPLMRGDEVPHAPHLAVTSAPWPDSVALYSAASDFGYSLDQVIGLRATVGVTTTPLARGPIGRIDAGEPLGVDLTSGSLSSTDIEGLLSGRNLLAIGDGTPDGWELLQFRDANVTAPGQYMLSHRLRGQLGTEAVMPDVWPAGSYVVLIDGTPAQIPLAPNQRGLLRHYRIGPASRGPDDLSYRHRAIAFSGVGLRPYAPCHLRAIPEASGDTRFSWVRRTRIDGDNWAQADVPLGEESQSYLISILSGDTLVRQLFTDQPDWTYSAAERAADGLSGAARCEVAQVSASFGPGPAATLTFNA